MPAEAGMRLTGYPEAAERSEGNVRIHRLDRSERPNVAPVIGSRRSGVGHLLLPLFLLNALTVGCGLQGDPLPPRRYVPATTDDLSIRQQGNLLILQFGYPQLTTAGEPLPAVAEVQIWNFDSPESDTGSVDSISFERGARQLFAVSGAELDSSILGDQIEVRIPLSEASPTEGHAEVFAVRTFSPSQEASAFSNHVSLRPRTSIEPPSELEVAAQPAGIVVQWRSVDDDAQGFHVYRRLSSQRRWGPPLTKLELGARFFTDDGVEYGERYIYTVRSIASLDPLIESSAATEREIHYLDRFAPDPPEAVLALPAADRVRLVLEASPSSDAIGYVVYRQDTGADFRRVTSEPITDLEYLDLGLVSGQTYVYRVSAVDDSGNEGATSYEVSVTLP